MILLLFCTGEETVWFGTLMFLMMQCTGMCIIYQIIQHHCCEITTMSHWSYCRTLSGLFASSARSKAYREDVHRLFAKEERQIRYLRGAMLNIN